MSILLERLTVIGDSMSANLVNEGSSVTESEIYRRRLRLAGISSTGYVRGSELRRKGWNDAVGGRLVQAG